MAVALRIFRRYSPAGTLLAELILAKASKRREKDCIVLVDELSAEVRWIPISLIHCARSDEVINYSR
jgi:hypothetical protein